MLPFSANRDFLDFEMSRGVSKCQALLEKHSSKVVPCHHIIMLYALRVQAEAP
jgi:hypothetical protein